MSLRRGAGHGASRVIAIASCCVAVAAAAPMLTACGRSEDALSDDIYGMKSLAELRELRASVAMQLQAFREAGNLDPDVERRMEQQIASIDRAIERKVAAGETEQTPAASPSER